MAGTDTLASLGEKITNVFVNAFASSNPGMSLVFLPFAVPAPDNIVQGGIVNPTRMTAFLVPNFDAPHLMSPSQYTVHGKDVDYGPGKSDLFDCRDLGPTDRAGRQRGVEAGQLGNRDGAIG